MIHRLIIYDRSSNDSNGLLVYDRGTIDIDDSMLLALIRAMLLLSQELGKVQKGYLKEIEIGKYQISLLDHEELTYILIIDTYDNELFVRRILNLCVSKYHDKFTRLEFKPGLPHDTTYQNELEGLIKTLNFPNELHDEIDNHARDTLARLNGRVDLLFLTDLDDGIARIFVKPEGSNDGLINVLLHVLSEIPLEKSWVGESRIEQIRKKKNIDDHTYEGWMFNRVGLTEFILCSRGFYDTCDREKIMLEIEEMSDQIHLSYINWLMN